MALVGLLIIALVAFRIVQNLMAQREKAASSRSGQAVSVTTSHAQRKTIVPRIKFSGTLDPIWQADVAAKVDGRVEQLFVQEGDRVSAGAPLARLEQTDLSAKLMNARGDYVDAQTTLEKAERDLARYEKLFAQGAVSEATVDDYRFAVRNARSKLDAARGDYDAAASSLEGSTVTTPHQGIVQKRYYQEGYYAKLGTALFNIADISELRAKMQVPEGYISDLQLGGQVQFTIPSLTQGSNQVTGTIMRISPVAEMPSRTFEVEVRVPNAQERLHGGVYADAQIVTREKPNALVVPLSAIVMREDQRCVYVIENNKAIRRVLKVGYIGDAEVEILGGITEQDNIVIAGQNKLREGSAVQAGKSTETLKDEQAKKQ